MSKDWTGNKNSIFKTLGASNHTDKERQNEDYYATDPVCLDKLIKKFDIPEIICEPCCGEGHLSKKLIELGHKVYSSDLINRGYGEVKDFFEMTELPEDCNCILTNPPYKYGLQIVNHSLDLLKDGGYCIMFLKTTFLEGKKRYQELFSKNPPKYMFQFTERVMCAKNGDFELMIASGGSAISYAFYIWQKGFKGKTTIDWI